jgi:hypothetical protein
MPGRKTNWCNFPESQNTDPFPAKRRGPGRPLSVLALPESPGILCGPLQSCRKPCQQHPICRRPTRPRQRSAAVDPVPFTLHSQFEDCRPTMAPPKPVIDQRAAEQMNLNVLKRIDPQIEEVGAPEMWAAAPLDSTWQCRPCAAACTAAASCHHALCFVPAAAGNGGACGSVRLRHPHQALGASSTVGVATAWCLPGHVLAHAHQERCPKNTSVLLPACLPASAEPQGCGGVPVPGEAPWPASLPVHHPQQEKRGWGLVVGM